VTIQTIARPPGYAPSDVMPIARLVTDAVVLANRADSPFTSLAEVVARAGQTIICASTR
jgi:tripartite-type tricarboxylate transporter receptor subunit TctC